MPAFGFRKRSSFGASPIDPRLFPLALLRASAAIKDEQLLADGVAELERNLATGSATPMLPRRMMQTANKAAADGSGPPVDPRLSAMQVAGAFAAAGRLAPAWNELTLPPQDEAAARAMIDARSGVMFPQRPGDLTPPDPAAQSAPTHFPPDAAVRAAYDGNNDGAIEMVDANSIAQRGGLIGRAMAELQAQSQKLLGTIRGR